MPFVDVGRREQIDVLMVKGEDYMGFYNVVEPPNGSGQWSVVSGQWSVVSGQ